METNPQPLEPNDDDVFHPERALPTPPKPPAKRTLWLALILPLVFAAGLGAGYVLWGLPLNQAKAAAEAQQQAAAAAAAEAQQVRRYPIPTEGSPSLGPDDAAITLVEFSDYECPYCKKWHDEVFPQLLKDYEGKIRFVYRNFPLVGLHANAAPAAEAALCAGQQGDYFDYHNQLFSMQYKLDRSGYVSYATDLGLDVKQFEACLDARTFQGQVEGDYQFASELGISSTPTFFINGLAIVGAQPYEIFQMVIDKELAGEIPQ